MDIDAIDKIDENDDRFQEKDSRENTEIIKFQVANGSQHTAFCELKEKLADVKSEHVRLQQKMLQLQMQYEEEILNKASPLTRNTRKRRDELEKLAQGCMEQSARAKADLERLVAIYADVDKMVCGLQQRHEHMVQQAKTRINGLLEELKGMKEQQTQLTEKYNESQLQRHARDSQLKAARCDRNELAAAKNELIKANVTFQSEKEARAKVEADLVKLTKKVSQLEAGMRLRPQRATRKSYLAYGAKMRSRSQRPPAPAPKRARDARDARHTALQTQSPPTKAPKRARADAPGTSAVGEADPPAAIPTLNLNVNQDSIYNFTESSEDSCARPGKSYLKFWAKKRSRDARDARDARHTALQAQSRANPSAGKRARVDAPGTSAAGEADPPAATWPKSPGQPDLRHFIKAESFSVHVPYTAILSLYLRNILCLHENAATVVYHIFIMMCYTMPLMGAVLADNYIGRYRVILYFSVIYFVGTVMLCCSAIPPLMLPPTSMSIIGLALIATGTGGIKPCVAAFGGDQFRLPEDNERLQKFFSTFYCVVNLGGFMGMVITPALRRGVMCFGDDACYALGFGFPAILVLISIVIFVMGKPWYRIKKPRDNATLKFVACAWYAFKKRIHYDRNRDGPPKEHWLDYSVDKYGEKLVTDMKIVCSILYLYLPVPIFWSLFDQQGSRWTFQASRLRGEIFGINLMPDQLQVMNPAMVLLMIPVCPGGAWPVLPEISPLHKMFAGGILAAMAFFCAGILQISIERSTLQVPGHHQTGIILLNTLACSVELAVSGEGAVRVEHGGTALVTPLPRRTYSVVATCPSNCAGRVMQRHLVHINLRTVAGMFMPVIIGQNSDDQISLYLMDPGPFTKSLTGKPKLKVVYIGDTGPNKNVSVEVETDKRLCDIYYVSDAPVDHIGESAYMCVQPGKFRWRASSGGGEVCGAGSGRLRVGGVYVLALRERRGRLDAAALHALNAPNELHLAWIVPQYLLVSMAEIMFAVSGLEFSFTQAPRSMKTITIAAWYMSVAIGNLIVILVAQAKIFESRAMEFFVYAGVLSAAMLVFLRMASGYHSRTMEGDGSSSESRPLLHRHSRAISVHSAQTSTRPFSEASRGSSAASCLVHMQRARPAAWPRRAVVHVGTPSSTSDKAATLAKD